MIPARPSPSKADPNVTVKNRKFLLIAVVVGLVFSAIFGLVLWLFNK